LASRQPEYHLSLLELLRSKPDGLKQLLEMLESKFSVVDSDAIRKALEHSNHRSYLVKQSLKLALTCDAVSAAFGETGAPVILRLPDSVQEWNLAAILCKLRASHGIAWPVEPTEAWLKQLVEKVLRFMFKSEGGTIGCVFSAAPTATHPAAALTFAITLWLCWPSTLLGLCHVRVSSLSHNAVVQWRPPRLWTCRLFVVRRRRQALGQFGP
jgi:hypothetical protein